MYSKLENHLLHLSIFRLEEDFDVGLSADMLISLTHMVKNLEGHYIDKEESGLDVLIKLGRYVIISYPKVPFPFQINVKRALVRSFIQIAGINEYFFTAFLDQVGELESLGSSILLMFAVSLFHQFVFIFRLQFLYA